MFQKMKNIDTAFRYIRLFSLFFLTGCTIVSVFIASSSSQMVSQAQQKVFILANGKALEAYASDRKDNIPVEAKDHIKMFHQYFFTLDPDEKVIQSNITKSLYLADASAKHQYDNLKEKGYFTNLIAGNVSQEIQMDSVVINIENYPYHFRFIGRQRIIRSTTIATRNLITEGYLRNVARSDNNSHGFLIEKWQTVENKDLTIENR